MSTSETGSAAVRRGFWTLGRREAAWGYLFLLPNVIGFLVFTALAVLAAFGLALTEWDLLVPPTFIGTANYAKLVTRDPVFRQAMINTAYFVAGVVPLDVISSLSLALLLNRPIRAMTLYRAIYFVPVVTSLIAVSIVWQWLYHSEVGLINYVLTGLGLPKINWLGSTEWAMPAIIFMSTWKAMGYYAVIFLAGLQGIPQHLYEAADIDGANARQRFWKITLPLLSPTMFFVLVISIIQSFQVFAQPFIMTRGGPADATITIVYFIYNNGFVWFRMGYAAAASWVLFAIIFLITILQARWQRRWVHY
ncbi:MAG TPA: sugar ABC transporter permease [Chloroflexota bacterium]|nr:sugar ABC transporter permease [Chloroflexota bacterium]